MLQCCTSQTASWSIFGGKMINPNQQQRQQWEKSDGNSCKNNPNQHEKQQCEKCLLLSAVFLDVQVWRNDSSLPKSVNTIDTYYQELPTNC